jgi:uncharacterized NAD-dependent epimerase/dehydratase family protein
VGRRLLILADGELGVFSSKTATSLIRYRPEDVVAVLDREHAGRTTREVLGVPAPRHSPEHLNTEHLNTAPQGVPIVANLQEALTLEPDTLVIGIAPQGGQLPPEWRPVLRGALEAGLDLVSGLHVFLGDDPELACLARERGRAITDLRRPPEGQPIAKMRAKGTRARRVLTVGTDCNVGKMVAALELAAAAGARGLDARFVATGQTGMLIAGAGVTLDRVPGDFMAGFVEQRVLADGDADLVIVEGQGCLLHPAYSGVTLALLHGTVPDAMVLVHHAGRTTMRNQALEIPPLREWVRRYEDALAPLHPGRVTGIAINPHGLSAAEAEAAVRQAEQETGLPAADVLTTGADGLLHAILNA